MGPGDAGVGACSANSGRRTGARARTGGTRTTPSYQAPGSRFRGTAGRGFGELAPANYASPAPDGGLMPPSLHWALVLVISIFCGFFALVWLFVQASFVKKLDPQQQIHHDVHRRFPSGNRRHDRHDCGGSEGGGGAMG